ncbi:MAG: methylenetetrahydrofolate reductase C-terminal domain-containing protein [Candidatus Omnitrophica bacterium]|nr:methylenetetrahydrofolate reductase C-terminal domain-containing protein [Candidatus Omnitrophota bacterium]MBU4303048.1 methylenetetrahydrofolate reductase C-terminal domain-containing protein [Candidatus Omnitrophota bacterium]MBU4419297.1 methylenetetrahydrofolate reductase C-terminal domain-containing protein [Candidatus Omnitrophota bacterium]MBU4468172.1 methylenetetrahydrofolate reductase C-terminal domain-containing protein [Candidatus Omnitrophota bacterium]MCG2707367.1 methylenetet
MIISQQKPLEDLLSSLAGYNKIFLMGCGECATACKSGGQPEIAKIQQALEAAGKVITGSCIPSAPCVAAKLKTELAKNMKALRQSEAALILACGLGVQSFKDNDRLDLAVLPACDTLFGAVMDAQGNFYEKCSMCGECVLEATAGICPLTLCPKSLLNGPCGGVSQGKCEVDNQKDCAWILIYRELDKKKKLASLKEIRKPKDFKKSARPHKLMIT